MELFSKISGQGPDLILLHGLFGSHENLGGISRLLQADFRVHALDLRNHGRSGHTDEMTYAQMASDVRLYLAQQNLEWAHVLGHSMGGKIAMTLALLHPQQVSALVVADIAPVPYPAHHDEVFAGLLSLKPDTISHRREAEEQLKKHVPETAVRQFLLKNLIRSPDGNFRWRLNLSGIHHAYPNILVGQEGKPYQGPTLFLKGGQSDYIQAKHRETTLQLFPNASLREIPETAHWLHAEKPELFARLVSRFLHSIR